MSSSQQRQNMGSNKTPSLYGGMTHIGDIHFWIVLSDKTTIRDIDFDSYNMIKKINKCKGKMKHEEFPSHIQKKLWKYHWKHSVKPYLTQITTSQCEENPQPFMCQLNSYCFMKENKGSRIAIGRMGWERKDKSIHWEYG